MEQQELRRGAKLVPTYTRAPSQAIDRDSRPRIRKSPKYQCPRALVGSRKSGTGAVLSCRVFAFLLRIRRPAKWVHRTRAKRLQIKKDPQSYTIRSFVVFAGMDKAVERSQIITMPRQDKGLPINKTMKSPPPLPLPGTSKHHHRHAPQRQRFRDSAHPRSQTQLR